MSVFSDAEREYLGSQRFGRLAAVGPDGTPRGAHRLPLQPPAGAGWGATEGKSANRSGSRQELSGTEVVASLLAGHGSRAVVCASSAGNLGQALAWSGRGRGVDVTVVASRFAPAAKIDRIRALDARLELVDGDFDMARERAAAVARYDGIRLVEDSLDIETCEGAATIGLELVDTVPSTPS